jgi:hypothetical protein
MKIMFRNFSWVFLINYMYWPCLYKHH